MIQYFQHTGREKHTFFRALCCFIQQYSIVVGSAVLLCTTLPVTAQTLRGTPYVLKTPAFVKLQQPLLQENGWLYGIKYAPAWSNTADTLVAMLGDSIAYRTLLPTTQVQNTIITQNDVCVSIHVRSGVVEIVHYSKTLQEQSRYTITEPTIEGAVRAVKAGKKSLLLHIGEGLYLVEYFSGAPTIRQLLLRPTAIAWSEQTHQYIVAETESATVVLTLLSEQGEILRRNTGVPLPKVDTIMIAGAQMALLADIGTSSVVAIVEGNQLKSQLLLPASLQHTAFTVAEAGNIVWYATLRREGYAVSAEITALPSEKKELAIPTGFSDILQTLTTKQGYNLVVFRNGIVLYDSVLATMLAGVQFLPGGAKILSADVLPQGIMRVGTTEGVYLFTLQPNHSLWWLEELWGDHKPEVLVAFVLFVTLLVAGKYRRQRQILSLVYNMREGEPIFVLDAIGRLRHVNQAGTLFLAIADSVPMKRFLRYYCTGAHLKEFAEFADAAIEAEATFSAKVSLPITLQNEEVIYDYFFSSVPVKGSFGSIKGYVVTGRDITNELQKKKLHNWAQLAHDMQTNLSIIKLNAEKVAGARTVTESADLGAKILFQTSVLIHRIRDLVTIGREDGLNLAEHDIADLLEEVVKEFDSSLFPHVQFHADVKPFLLMCDKPKLIRAFRNAVENAIRALKGQEGVITLAATQVASMAVIEITDNGVGMDGETLKNMNKPYFTMFSEQGGSGMGTMIMRHVIHLHGGEITVKSEKGVGTTFTFKLPLKGVQARKKMPETGNRKVTAAA